MRAALSSEAGAAALLQRALPAMPAKRHERRPIEFLNREEIDALLASADLSTWIGRRDQTLLLLTVQTNMIRKGQVRWLSKNDIAGQAAFVGRLLGLTAA